MTPIPATFIGIQTCPHYPDFELWTIWQDIEGHPSESTLSINTLTQAGYEPVEPVEGLA